ncbi:MAG: CDP-diacylglycerol--glycerol-3-phosphate 3-phosphatidyltransferase [Firmicutes bacterium ADurb.Bin182]|nr:MAG: CDP-diacylglycerol--glycerol-3-phosphate 3-phosphatidyltransferase [Firmicutes bacterium ADurb.Bin182]
MRHIPNILSFSRLIMVGGFIHFFTQNRYFAALLTYIVAFCTDLLDGFLARRNNWVTNLGKVLDPLADKLMLLAALYCFYAEGWISLWLLIIVLAKETIMIIGGLLLFRRKIVVYSDWFGKSATGFFNAGVTATLLKHFWSWIGIWNMVLLGVAVILAIIALIHYAKKNVFKNDLSKS